MNKLYLIFMLFFFFISQAFSQQLVILGKIYDRETQKPIALVNIGLENQNPISISNQNGDFKIQIDLKEKNATIYFSFVGYQKYTMSINDFLSAKPIAIFLEQDTKMMKEAIIKSKRLPTIERIMKNILKNISKNYPQKHYAYSAYYKEWLLEQDTCKKFTQSVLKLADNGYAPNTNFEMNCKLEAIQSSQDFTSFANINGIIDINFASKHNWLRNQQYLFKKENWESFTLKLENLTTFNNKIVYEITFESKLIGSYRNLKGRMLVNESDWAVVKITFEYDLDYTLFYDLPERQNSTAHHTEVCLIFNKYETTYLPFYQQVKGNMTYPNPKRIYTLLSARSYFELITQSVQTEGEILFETTDYQSIIELKKNNLFWNNYLIPPDTSEEQKMRKQLDNIKK